MQKRLRGDIGLWVSNILTIAHDKKPRDGDYSLPKRLTSPRPITLSNDPPLNVRIAS